MKLWIYILKYLKSNNAINFNRTLDEEKLYLYQMLNITLIQKCLKSNSFLFLNYHKTLKKNKEIGTN